MMERRGFLKAIGAGIGAAAAYLSPLGFLGAAAEPTHTITLSGLKLGEPDHGSPG